VVGPIAVRSCCAHHLVPIIGQCWIGTIPGPDSVIGLSKAIAWPNGSWPAHRSKRKGRTARQRDQGRQAPRPHHARQAYVLRPIQQRRPGAGGSNGTITDAGRYLWTITPTDTVDENGAAVVLGNLTKIAYINGTVWQESSAGMVVELELDCLGSRQRNSDKPAAGGMGKRQRRRRRINVEIIDVVPTSGRSRARAAYGLTDTDSEPLGRPRHRTIRRRCRRQL
jgi:hypothetical protein